MYLLPSREVLGNHHKDTLSRMGFMANLLQEQGELDEARSLFEEALRGRREVLGDRDDDTLTSINDLASLIEEQGKLAEAIPLFTEELGGVRGAPWH